MYSDDLFQFQNVGFSLFVLEQAKLMTNMIQG